MEVMMSKMSTFYRTLKNVNGKGHKEEYKRRSLKPLMEKAMEMKKKREKKRREEKKKWTTL